MPSYDGMTPTKSSDFLNKYSFIGWSPEITSALSSTEYMAVFEKIKLTSFVISYEAFGGQNVPSSQTKEKGLETTISDLIPTKTGYKFLGWNNKYEDKVYQPGDIFSLDGNVTLYAMWADICDACNGSANDVSEEDCSYCTNGKVSYWYCSYCQKETYVTVIMGLGPVCNMCHKKAQEKSKTCSYCNGKGYVTHINDCSSCDGRGYILPNAPILLTCEPRYVELQYIEGYEYSIDGVNWQGSNEFRNLTPNTTYNFYQRRKTDNELPFGIASDKLTITTPFDDTYYIYYELDGGVNNVNNPVEYNADSGKLTLFAPTKEHFEFVGWSLNGEIIESINTSLHTDIVLAAVWLPKQYTATFESNDGTFEKCTINLFYLENTEECVSYELEYGDKFNLNSVKIPEKDNYIFSGWFLDKDYSDEVKGTITIVSNINIYAKMVPVSLFTSKAIDNIASSGAYLFSMFESTNSYSSTISYSSKFIVDAYTNSLNLRIQTYFKGTITIYDLTADSQIFWCNTIDDSDFNYTINVTPFHIYEITLNSRGTLTGTGAFGNLYHHYIVCHINCIELSKTELIVDYLNYAKYVYGQKIILPNLERNGYKFLGWFDENNEPIHDVYDYETDMTFHAEWEKLN